MSTEKECTLKDLGFSFTFDPNCQSCGEGQCHNVVKCNINEKDCWVHLTADPACGTYTILITDWETGNQVEPKIVFNSNKETAKYLKDRFNFECA